MTKGIEQFTKALTAIGCAFVVSNGAVEVTSGYVYLNSLTTLPENTTFSNGGYVYLGSLPDGKYSYQGNLIRLRNIDGYTMLVLSDRTVGDYRVMACRYFGGGEIANLQHCFVAESKNHKAHGVTIAEAIRDCRFKDMQADFDAEELVETIKARGTIEFNDFRLLTGACAEGLRHGLQEAGLPADTETLDLEDALKAAHGPYGSAFKAMFAA